MARRRARHLICISGYLVEVLAFGIDGIRWHLLITKALQNIIMTFQRVHVRCKKLQLPRLPLHGVRAWKFDWCRDLSVGYRHAAREAAHESQLPRPDTGVRCAVPGADSVEVASRRREVERRPCAGGREERSRARRHSAVPVKPGAQLTVRR